MNSRSPNFPSPRFSNGTPTRSNQFGSRPPLHLQPNSPYMSPRGNRMSSPRPYSSPDFIPLGISSPVYRTKQRWSNQNYSSCNSSYSSFGSSSPNSNSSQNYSPYKRHGHRGNFRGRVRNNSSNNSGSNSFHISSYVDKECLQDPWEELESKMVKVGGSPSVEQAEGGDNQNVSNSDSDSSGSDDDS